MLMIHVILAKESTIFLTEAQPSQMGTSISVNIGSGNRLSPIRRQAITWPNADLLSTGPLRTKFSVMKIKNKHFLWRQCMKLSSAKWWPFYSNPKDHSGNGLGQWKMLTASLIGWAHTQNDPWELHVLRNPHVVKRLWFHKNLLRNSPCECSWASLDARSFWHSRDAKSCEIYIYRVYVQHQIRLN